MGLIPVTQYLYPDRDARLEHYDPENADVFVKAMAIIDMGFHFEAELLRGVGPVHVTISDDDEDYSSIVAIDGPALATSINKMITDFDLNTPHVGVIK